ncbi:MAG: Tetratricopeptide repeat protein, partial [Acidobacteria bacterium]|nr:Tetratricopeptide repeat protein [Acidobacteriota bacterium]
MNEVAMTHPEPETLAAFAQGRLHGVEAQAVVEHLDRCEECMSDVALAMEANGDEREAARFGAGPAPWLLGAAAAAALIAVVSIPATREFVHRPFRTSPTARLVALAPSTARVVEPRLTGGFAWAEYHGPERATEEATDSQRLRLGGVAGELMERAERDPDAEAQHAAGVAMVLVQKPLDGIARLEAAAGAARDAKRAAKDATIWSDLAAARYAAASSLGRASLYPSALAAADAALRIDPTLAEALFNRALILERMGLSQDARQAWQRYLEVDPSSRWAAEARTHMAELPAATPSSRFDRDRPLLERAAADGDARRLRELVDAHRERARAFGEAEYLGQWGEAVKRGDAAVATRWLTIARGIGDTLV